MGFGCFDQVTERLSEHDPNVAKPVLADESVLGHPDFAYSPGELAAYATDDAVVIDAPSGNGAVEVPPLTEWLVTNGFALDQVEIAGPLDVAAAAETTPPGEDVGVVKQGRYRLRTWAGPTPPELIDGMARLHTWNAGENRWMLAINREFGFAPTSALGAWEAATAGS